MFYLVLFSIAYNISIIIYAYSDLGYIFIAYISFLILINKCYIYYYVGTDVCPKGTEGTLSPPSPIEFK